MESNFPLSNGDFSDTVYGEIAVYFYEALTPFITERKGDTLSQKFIEQLNVFIDQEVKKVPAEKIEQWGLPVEQWAPVAKCERLRGYRTPPIVVYTGPHRFLILHGMFF